MAGQVVIAPCSIGTPRARQEPGEAGERGIPTGWKRILQRRV